METARMRAWTPCWSTPTPQTWAHLPLPCPPPWLRPIPRRPGIITSHSRLLPQHLRGSRCQSTSPRETASPSTASRSASSDCKCQSCNCFDLKRRCLLSRAGALLRRIVAKPALSQSGSPILSPLHALAWSIILNVVGSFCCTPGQYRCHKPWAVQLLLTGAGVCLLGC